MKNVDWENVDITGHGFEIMKKTQKAYEIMGLTQSNNMSATGNSSNMRSAVLSGNKSTKTSDIDH